MAQSGTCSGRPAKSSGPVAVQAEPEPVAFADRVFAAVLANDYGVYDGLVAITFPALAKAGVTHPEGAVGAGVGQSEGGDARWACRCRKAGPCWTSRDGQGDVDAFIALVPARRTEPSTPDRRDRPTPSRRRSALGSARRA